jgi:hypothetical protein
MNHRNMRPVLVILAIASATGFMPATAHSGWTISGTVVDENGKAVNGASVVGINYDNRRVETTTNERGQFQLAGPALGNTLPLVITDATRTRLWVRGAHRAFHETESRVDAVLTPPRNVTVEVVDAGGKPIADATVLLREHMIDVEQHQTGSDGVVKLRVPGNASMTSIYALKSGAGYDYMSSTRIIENGKRSDPGEIPGQLKLTLAGSRTLKVRAIDSQGQPMAGVAIIPFSVVRKGKTGDTNFSGTDVFQARTGPDGIAEFDWMPADLDGTVSFVCWTETLWSPNQLRLDFANRQIDLRVLRQTVLAGQVRQPDGKPAADRLVQAHGVGYSDLPGFGYAISGADGRFEMRVCPEHAYTLVVEHDRWAANRVGLVVREGQPVTDIDLALVEGTVLTGRVLRGPDNTLVPDTQVQALLVGGPIPAELKDPGRPFRNVIPEMSFALTRRTDADGKYRFVLGPAEYRVYAPPRSIEGFFNLTVLDDEERVYDIQMLEE